MLYTGQSRESLLISNGLDPVQKCYNKVHRNLEHLIIEISFRRKKNAHLKLACNTTLTDNIL